MSKKERVIEILKRLKKEYPNAKTALIFSTPFELLVSTILSAQATDSLVNKVTEKLFKKYKTIQDYAKIPIEELQKDINSVNYYKTKAKNIQEAAKLIIKNFKGNVPNTMEELITLPGVARKTANIVLSEAYGINQGIAVDTHVKRLSKLLGLTENENPVKIEQDLMAITSKNDWNKLSNLLILHGRNVCQAKKPAHDKCVLRDICPSNSI